MKSTLLNMTIMFVWIAGGMLLISPFALAGLALAYGEFGLAALIFGLGLLQATVFGSVMVTSGRQWLPGAPAAQLA